MDSGSDHSEESGESEIESSDDITDELDEHPEDRDTDWAPLEESSADPWQTELGGGSDDGDDADDNNSKNTVM